ncbi:isoleucine--tRNA ligase [Clostridiales bacterium COT073_COT-073]|nr:isoleucine--tRNA ligase [Clostridiales bacterium COT073_COT-073]
MYQKVSTKLNFVDREKAVLDFWKEKKIFEKSIEQKEACGRNYTFYDGPPTANGKPHIGHVLTRVIKDLIPRYHTMKGNHILRKAGWDTHGLPVELEVERELGIEGKEQIVDYGLEPFIQKCKESVWKYKGMWEDFSQTVGFWADMDDPYVTYHNEYIESVWWSLKQIWDKGLLYKGHKIVPYCPRCETALSSHEVAQGYKDVTEKTIIVRFRLKNEENTYFLAWTTTPWTLPSNVALALNPKETYVKAKQDGKFYILAEALLGAVLGEDAQVVETYTGKDLEYTEYEPLFPYAGVKEKAFYATCADYVTLTDGTGIVHIAPAFGEDDSKVGRAYGLPFVQLVTEKGEFPAGTPWAGIFVKNADPAIIQQLDDEGKLYRAMEHTHSYPHCWRCDTPLLYYAKDSWFIEMTKVREDLIRNNNTINWIPETIGKRRFGDWLENAVDWGLSRDRFWGTPLPIWECECGHRHAVGSIAELKSMSKDCPEEIELHRPFIDEVHITCEKCGKDMTRVLPVIDCWYDSGAMPFAQWHYPFENQDIFEKNFPADFISEAVDQTRGWFYSLLAISTLVFNKAPYKNVIVLGHVQDENGQKMSKSKGNAVDPFEALATYGADAIRWYFYNNSMPWLPNKFSGETVMEGQRKFMGTLWNTYAFYVLYAEIDQFNPINYPNWDKKNLCRMDEWLLSKLNTLVDYVDRNMAEYRITECTRAMTDFVDELSNWYVRRSRERFWQKDMPKDKIDAYMTLYTTLVTLVKVSAPFVPFIAEDIYQNLVAGLDQNAPESVHLCEFPVADKSLLHPDVEAQMEVVLNAVVLGRACRNTANIKNRQPLAKMYLKLTKELTPEFLDIIKEELNVKEVIVTAEVRDFTTYQFKPQLRTVGPKYGKLLGQIQKALKEVDGNAAMDELKANGFIRFEFNGEEVKLAEEDLLIESVKQEGYESAGNQEVTVVIDTTLTPELIEEGYVREVISKVQTMRKEADFEVTDHISFAYGDNPKLAAIIEKYADTIKEETLTDELFAGAGSAAAYSKQWDINGQNVTFAVERK